MYRQVWYRMNGDALRVTFGPDGSLSDAILVKLPLKHKVRVTGQLVGLTTHNSEQYLQSVGYRIDNQWSKEEKDKVDAVASKLLPGLEVESVSLELLYDEAHHVVDQERWSFVIVQDLDLGNAVPVPVQIIVEDEPFISLEKS